MENQKKLIEIFCKDAKYYRVTYDNNGTEFGKIIENKELSSVNLDTNEIRRSIEYTNDDRLFVLDLKPTLGELSDNSLQLVTNNLYEARAIEMVYPNVFTWVFDGMSVKAYAIVPSGNNKSHSTLTRYGGTTMFIRILRQHLRNIAKMKQGITPNYHFLDGKEEIEPDEISIGSVNSLNGNYSVCIDPNMTTFSVISQSLKCISLDYELHKFDMKYWAREINPDFIVEAKHIKLKSTLGIPDDYSIYPQPIKTMMGLEDKGNFVRFLLARFLLSVHNPTDAKFVYYSILSDEEREHVKNGNCSTQWNYILNNLDRYQCPTNKELVKFINKEVYNLSHPLEDINKIMEEKDANKGRTRDNTKDIEE